MAKDAIKKRNPIAKDILDQINDLIEDLGPVDLKDTEINDAEWDSDNNEEDMEQDWISKMQFITQK